jgi:hypothetical protein
MDGINSAWIPYFFALKEKYNKVKHLDENLIIDTKLKNIYKMGPFIPVFSSFLEMDKIKKDINKLYSKL